MTAPTAAKTCAIDDCARPVDSRGWCTAHYQRWKKHGDPTVGGPIRAYGKPRTCSVEGCDAAHCARGYCNSHYKQLARYGTPTHTRPPASPTALRGRWVLNPRTRIREYQEPA